MYIHTFTTDHMWGVPLKRIKGLCDSQEQVVTVWIVCSVHGQVHEVLQYYLAFKLSDRPSNLCNMQLNPCSCVKATDLFNSAKCWILITAVTYGCFHIHSQVYPSLVKGHLIALNSVPQPGIYRSYRVILNCWTSAGLTVVRHPCPSKAVLSNNANAVQL